jgi:LacI family transcriptional regulator
MRDLAKALNLSLSTVSRALRNDINISLENRERCQRAAREMGYEADASCARAYAQLRVKRVHKERPVLGLITSFEREDQWHSYYAQFVRHVRARAAQLGYKVEPFPIKAPGISSRRLTTILSARGIEGLIIGPDLPSGSHLSLDFSHFASAMCCNIVWRPRLHRAEPHSHQNTLVAIRHLRKLGYRRIGFASFAGNHRSCGHQSESAYYYAAATGIIREPIPVHIGKSFGGCEFIKWVKEFRPDAVLSSHPEATFGGLESLGLLPGENIGVASTGGVVPGLTNWAGINNHPDRVDGAVVELVVDQINRNERGVPEHPRVVMVEGSWMNGPTVRDVRNREVQETPTRIAKPRRLSS